MKNVNKKVLTVLAVILLITAFSSAVPTFQVYSPDATAGDYYEDQDTWFASNNPFDISVLGAYGPTTTSLTDVVLLISVPDGETGTLTVIGTNGAGNPGLMTLATGYVPTANADIDIIGALTGYSDKSFLPDDPAKANFNNHYPLGDDTSDFLLFDLGSFLDQGTSINDYNADGGTITSTGWTGEIKTYSITTTGFSSVHVDAFGLETDALSKKLKYSWDISPGSHDTTNVVVPVPGAFLLGGIGVSVVGWIKRRRML